MTFVLLLQHCKQVPHVLIRLPMHASYCLLQLLGNACTEVLEHISSYAGWCCRWQCCGRRFLSKFGHLLLYKLKHTGLIAPYCLRSFLRCSPYLVHAWHWRCGRWWSLALLGQLGHLLLYKLVSLVLPYALFGQLPPKFLGLLLQSLLMVLSRLLQTCLKRCIGALSLRGHLLSKLLDFVSRWTICFAGSLARGFVPVFVCCSSMLIQGRLLFSELRHCKTIIKVQSHAVWQLDRIVLFELLQDLLVRWSFCCLLYTSPSPRDRQKSRMPSSA